MTFTIGKKRKFDIDHNLRKQCEQCSGAIHRISIVIQNNIIKKYEYVYV